MARTKAAAPVVEEQEEDYPLGHYMDKEPSQTNQNFVDYVLEEVGYQECDVKTVQLVIALYQKFQKSPEQQAFNAEKKAKAAAAAEAREAKAEEKASAPAKAAPVKRASKRAATAPADEDEAPAAPRTGRARRGQVAAPAPAKRATGRRRPVPAVDEDVE